MQIDWKTAVVCADTEKQKARVEKGHAGRCARISKARAKAVGSVKIAQSSVGTSNLVGVGVGTAAVAGSSATVLTPPAAKLYTEKFAVIAVQTIRLLSHG